MVTIDYEASSEDYIRTQREWAEIHGYFMAKEACREIGHNEAGADFLFGNDHLFDKDGPGQPSPDIKSHYSERGLTWEQEYRLHYTKRKILPAIENGNLPECQRGFAEGKIKRLVNEGIFDLEPMELSIA